MKLRLLENIDPEKIQNKRVFLRADLNIPIKTCPGLDPGACPGLDPGNKKIIHDYRIKALLPTIDFIHKHGGKVILATHIGRPDAHSKTNFFDPKLSTNIITQYLEHNNYQVEYEKDLLHAQTKSMHHTKHILLLENMRFFNGETEPDNSLFAELLAKLADIYVNDAFGLIHRNDTSVTLLAEQFEPENRFAGLLIKKELTELDKIKTPKQPFIVLLGGNKMRDKIKLLEALLPEAQSTNKTPNDSSKNKPHAILIGGALAHVFLKAQGIAIGRSLCDEKSIPLAQTFLERAQKNNIPILLPQDMHVLTQTNPPKTSVCPINELPHNALCIDIGPETIKAYTNALQKADTIFSNGTMGAYENPAGQTGTKKMLEAVARSEAYTVIGGGDAVAATHMFGFQNDINFLSTGGGATLAYLGSRNPEKDFLTLAKLCV